MSRWLDHLAMATLLAGLTGLLLSSALRRIRPAMEVALWSVVLLKFLLPMAPPSRYSLSTWTSRALHPTVATDLASYSDSKAPAPTARSQSTGPLQATTDRSASNLVL